MMMSVASSSGHHRQLSFGTGFEPSVVSADFTPKATRATLPPSPVTPTDTTPRQALFSTEPLRVPPMAPPSRGRTGRDQTRKSVSPRKRNSWKRESSEGYSQPRTPRSSMSWASGPSPHVYYSSHMHSPAISYPLFAEHQIKREFVPHEYACAPASYLPYAAASQPQSYAYSPFDNGVSYGHDAVPPFYAAPCSPWTTGYIYAAPPPPWSGTSGSTWQQPQPQQEMLSPSHQSALQPCSRSDQQSSGSVGSASSPIDIKMEVIPLEWSSLAPSPAVGVPPESTGPTLTTNTTSFLPFEQISPVPTLEATTADATPVPTSSTWSPIRPLTPQTLATSSSSLPLDGFALFNPRSAAESLASSPGITVNGPLPQTLEEWVAFVDSLNL